MKTNTAENLRKQIAALEARLVDLQARLPAHSTPPAMIAELDDLDEEMEALRNALQRLEADTAT